MLLMSLGFYVSHKAREQLLEVKLKKDSVLSQAKKKIEKFKSVGFMMVS